MSPPKTSTKAALPRQGDSLVEALESQIELLESTLAFVRSELAEMTLARDRWRASSLALSRQVDELDTQLRARPEAPS
jgi:hypothetical protein